MAESNLSEDRNCIAHSSRSKEGRRISRMHSRQAAPNLATANICNLSGIPVCVPPLIVDRFSASSEARLIGLLVVMVHRFAVEGAAIPEKSVAAGCALLPEVH